MKKKINIKNAKGMISKAVDTSKTMVTKANDFALNTTEVVVSESLEATAKWQTVADNAIKGGLKLAKNQQDIVFDVLNEIKGQVKESKKRLTKLVA